MGLTENHIPIYTAE